MPQFSNSGRIVTLVAVSQGNVYYANAGDLVWAAATNTTGDTPPLNSTGIMFSAQNALNLWFADGINWVFYDPLTQTVNRWEASYGSLPVDSENNTPRIIETWRGRTCLSGLLLDPQNIHMSRVNQPTDFDNFPDTDRIGEDQAIALSAAPQGLCGDLVSGMIPYNDDVLVIGCDSSIYALSGDPMAGGQLDLITKAMGMAWGRAWCMDPYGTIYFCSNNMRIFAMRPGTQPQPISQPIDPLLNDTDTGLYNIRLGWDDRFQGFHTFITPLDEPGVSTHFFWEQRTGAWFTEQFANKKHSPLTCCTFDGNEPGDRTLLIGSWDGYVRKFDAAAEDDDGSPISSSVTIGPFVSGALDELMLEEIQAVLGETSGEVAYAVHVGSTAEKALSSTAVQVGTWGSGRNLTNLIKRAGHAVYVKISSSNPWSMEQIRAVVSARGMIRQRGR